ncbi:hypothetical protein RSSE_c3573 [Ralstonia solanacearum]|nr:hypothetical protein RSSE_c3573 [Ralstonia solanacearum]
MTSLRLVIARGTRQAPVLPLRRPRGLHFPFPRPFYCGKAWGVPTWVNPLLLR